MSCAVDADAAPSSATANAMTELLIRLIFLRFKAAILHIEAVRSKVRD
jgi:hypothetical protein